MLYILGLGILSLALVTFSRVREHFAYRRHRAEIMARLKHYVER